MKKCLICHVLLCGRRWLALPLMLAAALLLFLPGWLPTRLWLAVASAVLLLAAMLLIYRRDLPRVWTARHLRMPSPRDARAEIVMVDAALIDHGPRVLSSAQPVEPVAEMSLRMGSGALLLGTAMILMRHELDSADAAALTAAAEKLNLQPAAIRRRSPILSRAQEGELIRLTVQDGTEERSFFLGNAEALLKACGSIWEDRIRLMAPGDAARIRQTAQDMESAGCRIHAFGTAAQDGLLVFLGMAAIGDDVDPVAVSELHALRAMGLTLILRDDKTHPMDVPRLRRMLDVPDLHARPDIHLCIADPWPDKHCLSIIRHEEHALAKPVQALREHFATMALMLDRLMGLMGLCLLLCILAGGALSAPAASAVLAAGYLSFGSLTEARAIRPWEATLTAVGILLVRLMLNAAVPQAADAAGSCLCIALAAVLSLTMAVPGQKLAFRTLLPLLLTALTCLGVQTLLAMSLLPGVLLPMAFCTVSGLLTGLPFCITRR